MLIAVFVEGEEILGAGRVNGEDAGGYFVVGLGWRIVAGARVDLLGHPSCLVHLKSMSANDRMQVAPLKWTQLMISAWRSTP